MDLSCCPLIKPGSLFYAAETILCDEQLRTPLLSKKRIADQISEMKLSYLLPLANGDSVFNGPIKTVSNKDYQFETLVFWVHPQDRSVVRTVRWKDIIGLPFRFRGVAQTVQTFCKDRKAQSPKIEYYDAEGNLMAAS